MTIIYLVSKGSYSDYDITGVYSTRELAEKVVGLGIGDAIREYTLDLCEPQIRAGLLPYGGTITKDGNSWIFSHGFEDFTEKFEFLIWDKQRSLENKLLPASVVLKFCVYAESKEHAAKIANEHRAYLIASGEWDRFEGENNGS